MIFRAPKCEGSHYWLVASQLRKILFGSAQNNIKLLNSFLLRLHNQRLKLNPALKTRRNILRIYVISDTHGRADKAAAIYKTLQDIDLIVHLGDHWNDAKRMKEQLNVPLIGVKGNMDGSFARDGYHILETDFGKIFLAHGHMENVKHGLETIIYKAGSLQCRAAFFGHTHIPLFLEAEGIYLLNPGSLALPVGGRKGSYAVVTVTKDSLNAAILYEEAPQTRRTGPGPIRNMLNDSDRF
jgi:putative phosphoesterase